MDKQDLFRVFDACRPTVAQVREYLERISGHSPFRLIFIKGGKENTTKMLERNLGLLSGIIIEDTVFYVKTMSEKDNQDDRSLTANDIFAFGRGNVHLKAHPMRKADVLLLGKHRKDYETLCNMLEVFGYTAPALQDFYIPLENPGNYSQAGDCDLSGYNDGCTDIACFLHFRNILFCSERKTVSI